jgi:hypothetical protein
VAAKPWSTADIYFRPEAVFVKGKLAQLFYIKNARAGQFFLLAHYDPLAFKIIYVKLLYYEFKNVHGIFAEIFLLIAYKNRNVKKNCSQSDIL